jgi:PAT family beta-lactamase induction signal transducer AmpG
LSYDSDAATPLNPDPKDAPPPGALAEPNHAPVATGPLPLDPDAPRGVAINPWLFVPVLYFMQFLPNGVVTSLMGSVYKSLGEDNVKITTWTGLAALPWVFKMFWGPLVDLNYTKRRWTLAMQVLIAVGLLITAASMGTSGYFVLSVAAMFLIATFSATHDIACDGLYLLSLDK